MEAMRIHKFGDADVLERDEVTAPIAGRGELVVQVMAASVNPVDFKMRAGGYPKATDQNLPITLGRDLAGVVDTLGPDIAGFSLGDDVFAMLGWDRGAYAQYVVVKPEEVARMPANLGYAEAAAVPLAGLTAWQGLFDHGGLEAGQRVLIHGGSGGVGHLAVQFAKARGAFVATTVGTEDIDFARALGADQVIDYKRQRFEDEVADMDVVYDLVAGETQSRSWDVLRPGGIIVSTLQEPSQDEAKRRGMRGVHYMAKPDSGELAQIAALIESGKVRPRIQSTFPMDQAGEAQTFLEHDHPQGKVVLEIAPAVNEASAR